MARGEAVWITGVGAATPLGNDFETFADNLLAGRSATRQVSDQQGDKVALHVGTEVGPLSAPRGMAAERFARLSRLEQMAWWCSLNALRDADLADRPEGLRVGLVLGLGGEWYRHWKLDAERDGRQIFEPSGQETPLVERLKQDLNLTGPTATTGAACASANYALALGRRWVALGLVDVCLAGGVDNACPITRANFANLRALSRRVDDAEHACRPFDLARDGLVMGEGGAIFVLESAAAARRRGQRAYGEIAGFGASSDAAHMIIPSDDPAPAALAMQRALADAHLAPSEVNYINAHATSTQVGDRAEARAIRLVFGERTAATPISSTKSMTGHLVSAAAAIEALACVVALQKQTLPPTINLDDPDPQCDLCHVANQAQPRKAEVAISNSFGFGGSNTCLALRKAA
ncbi:MAG: beta-ketoacyl-[acyl-carrier-protein] synthase family protein [Pirellulaceae bacterium]|nr:beta-ketoacyl-[acyl-carrier-protein] synthase family protein [Pirellulaceae bacterium]